MAYFQEGLFSKERIIGGNFAFQIRLRKQPKTAFKLTVHGLILGRAYYWRAFCK